MWSIIWDPILLVQRDTWYNRRDWSTWWNSMVDVFMSFGLLDYDLPDYYERNRVIWQSGLLYGIVSLHCDDDLFYSWNYFERSRSWISTYVLSEGKVYSVISFYLFFWTKIPQNRVWKVVWNHEFEHIISDGGAIKTNRMDGCGKSSFLLIWFSFWIYDFFWQLQSNW